MSLSELDQFNELARACGNRYLAVQYIAKASRYLNRTIPERVLESKLISWALTGEKPDLSKYTATFYLENPEIADVLYFLDYVEDIRVKKAVIALYRASVNKKHLTYTCDEYIDPAIESRVRVLLRMLWYRIKTEDD